MPSDESISGTERESKAVSLLLILSYFAMGIFIIWFNPLKPDILNIVVFLIVMLAVVVSTGRFIHDSLNKVIFPKGGDA